MPRLLYASGKSGLSAMALRKAASASVQLLLIMQGNAEVVVHFGEIGLKVDGLAEGRHRLRQLLLLSRAMPRLLYASG